MVEIYQNTELNDVCFEVEKLQEWNELNKELGLTKQLDFTKSSDSPIPYPWINTSMERIFETLCPRKVNYKEYDKTPIPLEVLKQLAYSVKENHCNNYEVWYDDKTPDPFLIGYKTKYYGHYTVDNAKVDIRDEKGNHVHFDSKEDCEHWCMANGKEFNSVQETWDKKRYLIARWADVLRPIVELKEMAKERLLEKYGIELRKEIEERTSALKNLTDHVAGFLAGDISESQLKGARW